MITLTAKAAEEIGKIYAEQQLDPASIYLRMGVKGGGCSGFNYNLDMVEGKSDSDEEFESHGIKVICDSKSYLYLKGTELDFKDELMGRGFVFHNPNATSRCGCGSSFNAQ